MSSTRPPRLVRSCFEEPREESAATEDHSCIDMNKPKATTETSGLPPVKPWSFRVAHTGAKKYGARENWPSDMRQARARTRKDKRDARGDPTEVEFRLRAESKTGGIEAKIARMKLSALKQNRRVCAEAMRKELADRIQRFRASRIAAPNDADNPR